MPDSLPRVGKFPDYRPRRLRKNPALRALVKETHFSLSQLVMPYFVREGKKVKETIEMMPGQYRFSPDMILPEIESLQKAGINTVLLFGIPDQKDERASASRSQKGVVQQAVRAIKKRFPEMAVMTDVCLCAYMSHGHCGRLNHKGEIDNDGSLPLLAQMALSHAEAGADIVSPSDMMDGRIQSIRQALDKNQFSNVAIMSYAAKYSSAFYGPFRDAAHSAPKTRSRKSNAPKDRASYQMDPSNLKEAVKEIAMDIDEGADIVMVKPALAYLDVIREAGRLFPYPIAAYSVSGEYSMIKSAVKAGYADEREIVREMMTGFFRAGAQIVISYHAKNIASWKLS